MTSGPERAPNRAMLRAIGFGDDDFRLPIIGVASAGAEVSPCNIHHDELAALAKAEFIASGAAKPMKFNTFLVTDGEAMGTEGMKASLPSRDVIADAIELVVRGHSMDGLLAIGGCDKTVPGSIMPMARLNIPSIFCYGGTIKAGTHEGRKLDIVSVFEAVGAHAAGRMGDEELHSVECKSCPGPGACGGMYTANTMAAAAEALGMSLPGSASIPAVEDAKAKHMRASARALLNMIEKGIRPRDIMTRKAFENAIRTVMALGGSTNAVLHLVALAHEAEVPLEAREFNYFHDTTPTLTDMKPAGRYVMEDLHRVGGVSLVMKMLLDHGLLHGDALTCTGKTVAENLAAVSVDLAGQDVVLGFDAPQKATGPFCMLYGNLAPRGAVLKTCGLDLVEHSGPGPRLREREDRARRHPRRESSRWRRRRHPVRRPQGRPRHARDARPDGCHSRRGTRGQGGPRHGRTLFGRQPRHDRRPRLPRGPGERPDSRIARRRRRVDLAVAQGALRRVERSRNRRQALRLGATGHRLQARRARQVRPPVLGRIVGGGHQLTSNRMGVALAAALLIASSALPRQVAAEQQAAAQPQPAAEPRLTLMAVGDIMLGRSVGRALVAQGASVPFAKVAETFRSADLVVGNLECVISSLGTPAPKSYHLRAPYEAVESLAGAGFAVVNLANNHAMDFGYDAMADMRKRLADRGIASAGAGADEAEAHSAVVVLRGGLRVAFLGYVDVPVEGLTKFATSSWVALGDKPGLAWPTAPG